MVKDNKTPEGYKNTDVGVIPEDWDVIKLSELGSCKKGKNIPKKLLVFDGEPCVLYGEIYTKYNYTSKKLDSFIPKELTKKATEISYGDILFASSGETKEEIGKCFTYIGTEKAYAGGDIIILTPEKGDSTFLGYLLNSKMVNEQKATLGQGSSVIHIYSNTLSKIDIPLPPIPEQQAIAEVLNNIDLLIEALEKLIDKKEKIKQGTMQELLSGKRRLSGFDEEWKVDEVKNLADISTGNKNTQDKIENGKFPFFVRSDTVERINSYSYDGEAVLTAGDGVGTGKIFHYINGKFDYHQRVYKISDFNKRIDGYFFYLFFSNKFLERIMSMTAKSSVDSVRMDMIAEMEISLPPIKEQKAIAQILSDIDAEIEGLEKKAEKYRKIKKGMMQELLTGRTRLV